MSPNNRISRRQFLGRGAAAAAVPLFIPAGVLAAPGRPGANGRIGIAGIGIGRQGSGDLADCMKDARSRFIAIADVNLPRARQLAKKYGGEPFLDYRKLLERRDVDAIITATVDHWRAIVSIHCCQAGKHVYAEKPLTLTIREGRLMVEAARKYNRVFQTGSQQRSMADQPRDVRIHPQRQAGQNHASDRQQLSQPLGVQVCRAAGPRGARLGHVVRPRAAGAVSRGPLLAAFAIPAGFRFARIPAAK